MSRVESRDKSWADEALNRCATGFDRAPLHRSDPGADISGALGGLWMFRANSRVAAKRIGEQ
ncbi:hypothetical protein ACVIIW_004817 [Bradyrhizobium sp. USDA 4449]